MRRPRATLRLSIQFLGLTCAWRAVGQWPTGESLIERLAAGIAEAAETEPDPERKRTFKMVARELGGMTKAIAVNVASQLNGHQVVH
jgi:hypothetical protein